MKYLLLFLFSLLCLSVASAQNMKKTMPSVHSNPPFKSFNLSDLANSEEESFFSKKTKRKILETKEVVASAYAKMLLSPSMLPETKAGNNKNLSPSQRELVLSSLSSSKKLSDNERFNNCHYLPGMKFSLRDTESKKILSEVLLCLNCDVWAVVV